MFDEFLLFSSCFSSLFSNKLINLRSKTFFRIFHYCFVAVVDHVLRFLFVFFLKQKKIAINSHFSLDDENDDDDITLIVSNRPSIHLSFWRLIVIYLISPFPLRYNVPDEMKTKQKISRFYFYSHGSLIRVSNV